MADSIVVVIVKDSSATLPPHAINTANVVFSILVLRFHLQGTMIYTSRLRKRQLLHGLSIIIDNLLEVVLGRVMLIDV